MGLRSWSEVPYLPLLAISPAEMRALQELPNKNKDLILPYVHLKPWSRSNHVTSSTDRVEAAYADRPYVLDIADPEPRTTVEERPVFAEIEALRQPDNGYSNWCDFVEERDHIIPALQVRSVANIPKQVERLYGLGRGLVVHIRPQMLGAFEPLVKLVADLSDAGDDVCFVIDFGRQREDFLLNQARTVGYLNAIRSAAGKAYIAISASSFPESFTSISDQQIFERSHFNGVANTVGPAGLIYSDRGSARAEKQLGGGGTPAPRIDYAKSGSWNFFRNDPVDRDERPAAYVKQAKKAVDADCWDKNLNVWGAQMIAKTAAEKANGISTQQVAAASRINIHLHHQLFHNDPDGLYDTDEDWTD